MGYDEHGKIALDYIEHKLRPVVLLVAFESDIVHYFFDFCITTACESPVKISSSIPVLIETNRQAKILEMFF